MTTAPKKTHPSAKAKPQSSPRPLTNAEHQARWRAKNNALAKLAAAQIAAGQIAVGPGTSLLRKGTHLPGTSLLRKETHLQTLSPLRKVAETTADDLDERLLTLKQQGDALLTAYSTLIKTPGLTAAEVRTISERLKTLRQNFDKAAKHAPRRVTVATPTVKRTR